MTFEQAGMREALGSWPAVEKEIAMHLGILRVSRLSRMDPDRVQLSWAARVGGP